MRYFSPDLDISTFNRLFHTILRAERSAHVFQRRNKPRNYKHRNDSSILSKIMRYFSPDLDISSFNRLFHTILRAERSAHVSQRRNKPRTSKIAIIRRFCQNLCVIFPPT